MEPSLSTIPEQSLKIYLPELAMEMNKKGSPGSSHDPWLKLMKLMKPYFSSNCSFPVIDFGNILPPTMPGGGVESGGKIVANPILHKANAKVGTDTKGSWRNARPPGLTKGLQE